MRVFVVVSAVDEPEWGGSYAKLEVLAYPNREAAVRENAGLFGKFALEMELAEAFAAADGQITSGLHGMKKSAKGYLEREKWLKEFFDETRRLTQKKRIRFLIGEYPRMVKSNNQHLINEIEHLRLNEAALFEEVEEELKNDKRD